MLSDNWSDISTAPTDGTTIIIKRKLKPGLPMRAEIEAHYRYNRNGGFWTTKRSAGIKDEDIIGWQPKPPGWEASQKPIRPQKVRLGERKESGAD